MLVPANYEAKRSIAVTLGKERVIEFVSSGERKRTSLYKAFHKVKALACGRKLYKIFWNRIWFFLLRVTPESGAAWG